MGSIKIDKDRTQEKLSHEKHNSRREEMQKGHNADDTDDAWGQLNKVPEKEQILHHSLADLKT